MAGDQYNSGQCRALHKAIDKNLDDLNADVKDLREAVNGKINRVHDRIDKLLYVALATLLTSLISLGVAVITKL